MVITREYVHFDRSLYILKHQNKIRSKVKNPTAKISIHQICMYVCNKSISDLLKGHDKIVPYIYPII